MSRLVARILLSIFMFPLAGIFYILIIVVGIDVFRRQMSSRITETAMFTTAGLLTWIVVAAYWCLLWHASIEWNSRRITWTLMSAVGAMIAAGAVGGVIAASMSSSDASFGAFIGGVLAIVLWLIATVFIWRETAAERIKRVSASSANAIACPNCGYNMTGLGEARCPECGSKFTLDELVGSLPNRHPEID
jgi:DNA-directed RNA polymerase subunit RPC12/RpoP